MSPNSNTSSLDPRNGSAYSRSHADFTSQNASNGSAYTTRAHSSTGFPPARSAEFTQELRRDTLIGMHDQPPYLSGYHADEYTDNQPYSIESRSQSASTYDNYPQPEQNEEHPRNDQGQQHYGHYYLPTTSYPPQEPPSYDPELAIDSVEDGLSEALVNPSQHPNQAGNAAYAAPEDMTSRVAEAPTTVRYTQQNSHREIAARAPTVRRWSGEYSPDERIRVGLPRWESEQHRIEYERRQRGQGRRS